MNTVFAILSFFLSFVTLIYQEIPIKYGPNLQLGNYSSIISFLFFIAGVYIMSYVIKNNRKDKEDKYL